MSFFKNRKLVLHTGDKQFNWRHRHEQSWYIKLPFFLRNCYDYMIDKSDTGGVFDCMLLYDWQYEAFRDDSKFWSMDKIINSLNEHRTLLRKLHDVDKKTGEEKWNGLVLIEDYYCLVCGHGTLDVNKHKSSYEKGIINSYIKHGIDFNKIRGLKAVNLKYSKKKGKSSKGSERDK